MGKAEDVLKQMILLHGKRIVREALGDLPAQTKQAQRDIRTIQKTLEKLTRQVERLVEQKEPKAPVLAAPEEEVEKARFTKRTLPALRKRFGLKQHELAKLLQVGSLTISSWERGKSRPRSESIARIVALRLMSPEQVEAALGREPASPAMTPQQIKALRSKLCLSQGELAEHLGVSKAAVGQWEQGRSAPRSSNLEALGRLAEMGQKKRGGPVKQQSIRQAVKEPAEQTELLPEEIVGIRKKAGLSQRALAEKLGVSVNSVSNWETGSTKPEAKNIEKLLAVEKGAPERGHTELTAVEIRGIRNGAGLSQKALAEKLGVSVNSVSNWETGRSSPRAASLKKLLGMRK